MTSGRGRKCGKGTKNVETMNSSSFPLNFATEQITTFDSNEKVSHLEWGKLLYGKPFLSFFLVVCLLSFFFRFMKNENPSSLSFIKQDFPLRNKWFLILLILVCERQESGDNGKSVPCIGLEPLFVDFH